MNGAGLVQNHFFIMSTPQKFVNSLLGLIKPVRTIVVRNETESVLLPFLSKEIDTRCCVKDNAIRVVAIGWSGRLSCKALILMV